MLCQTNTGDNATAQVQSLEQGYTLFEKYGLFPPRIYTHADLVTIECGITNPIVISDKHAIVDASVFQNRDTPLRLKASRKPYFTTTLAKKLTGTSINPAYRDFDQQAQSFMDFYKLSKNEAMVHDSTTPQRIGIITLNNELLSEKLSEVMYETPLFSFNIPVVISSSRGVFYECIVAYDAAMKKKSLNLIAVGTRPATALSLADFSYISSHYNGSRGAPACIDPTVSGDHGSFFALDTLHIKAPLINPVGIELTVDDHRMCLYYTPFVRSRTLRIIPIDDQNRAVPSELSASSLRSLEDVILSVSARKQKNYTSPNFISHVLDGLLK